jgi:hypothetical protein
MRRMVVLIGLVAMHGVMAQPKLEPVPEPPPPPPGSVDAPEDQAVRIPEPKSDKVEEIRAGGQVVMLKVTPASGGRPYYLVDPTGAGMWMRRDSLDVGLRVPMWPLFIFE